MVVVGIFSIELELYCMVVFVFEFGLWELIICVWICYDVDYDCECVFVLFD